MNRRRKKKNIQKHIKIAVTTNPRLLNLSIQDMDKLTGSSICDAFVPKMLVMTSTPERADELHQENMRNPYWQQKYRKQSEEEIINRYGGVLPINSQYQLDTHTFISCLKVETSVSFDPLTHWETIRPVHFEDNISNFDPSEIFFQLVSEEHVPAINTWDDIRWNDIGIVPKEVFYRFIHILLRRLEPILSNMWKSGIGFASAQGYDQEIVKGTYFDDLKNQFINS